MLIRILTEDVHRTWLCNTVSEYFPSFTVYKAQGFWKGSRESSLVFEIDTDRAWSLEYKLKELCNKIKGYNRQSSVLVQRLMIDSEYY